MTLGTGIAILVACLTFEAFFSGSEMAMINADRVALRARAENGDRAAQRALDLLSDEARLLGTVLIGTNLCTVTGAAVMANLLLSRGAEGLLTALAFTPFTLIFGEALPKTVMQHHADRLAPMLALPLSGFRFAFRPFLGIVRLWNTLLTRAVGRDAASRMTRQELLELLEDEEAGPIAPEERRLIRGVLALPDATVEDAMTPLVQVVAVAQDATVGVAAGIAARTHHARLPVYDQRVDHIVGVVHQADLLFLDDDTEPLAPHVRPVPYVPDVKQADELFAEMRTSGEHFAVVVDEYGGCVGLVTLEDLLEEFVGEIEDERDRVRQRILPLEDGSWTMPGVTEVDDVAERTGVDLPEGDHETVAGVILAELGRIPAVGEEIAVDGVRLRVEAATARRIERVRLIVPPEIDEA